jgi:hypothetical protein
MATDLQDCYLLEFQGSKRLNITSIVSQLTKVSIRVRSGLGLKVLTTAMIVKIIQAQVSVEISSFQQLQLASKALKCSLLHCMSQ